MTTVMSQKRPVRAAPSANLVPSARTRGHVAITVGIAVLAALLMVDFAPQVDANVFFAADDSAARATAALGERFSARDPLIIRVDALTADRDSMGDFVGVLGDALEGIDGVERAYSTSSDGIDVDSPIWGPVLAPEDSEALYVVATLGPDIDPAVLTESVDSVLARFERPGIRLLASGVPLILERIRHELSRDLLVFFVVATLLVFAIGVCLYRNVGLVLGTLLACWGACACTLVLLQWTGVGVGLLTVNAVPIVFVLTLSHTVFLTARWKRAVATDTAEAGPPIGGDHRGVLVADAVKNAWKSTVGPSSVCALTTILGFGILAWVLPAKPLRDFGLAGLVGTIMALLSAFLLFPPWLPNSRFRLGEKGGWTRAAGIRIMRSIAVRFAGCRDRIPGGLRLGALLCIVAALFYELSSVHTDPPLPGYFDPGGDIRPGLEAMDREGGISTLLIAVQSNDSPEAVADSIGRVDGRTLLDMRTLRELHRLLEEDPSTGMVLSPSLLRDEAVRLIRRGFGSYDDRFVSDSLAVRLLALPLVEAAGLPRWVTKGGTEVLYTIRMIEGGRSPLCQWPAYTEAEND